MRFESRPQNILFVSAVVPGILLNMSFEQGSTSLLEDERLSGETWLKPSQHNRSKAYLLQSQHQS